MANLGRCSESGSAADAALAGLRDHHSVRARGERHRGRIDRRAAHGKSCAYVRAPAAMNNAVNATVAPEPRTASIGRSVLIPIPRD